MNGLRHYAEYRQSSHRWYGIVEEHGYFGQPVFKLFVRPCRDKNSAKENAKLAYNYLLTKRQGKEPKCTIVF